MLGRFALARLRLTFTISGNRHPDLAPFRKTPSGRGIAISPSETTAPARLQRII